MMRQRTLTERIESERSSAAGQVFTRWSEALEQMSSGTAVMVSLRDPATGQSKEYRLVDVRVIKEGEVT